MEWALMAACFAVGAAVPWMVRAVRNRGRMQVSVVIDGESPRPKDVAGYLAEIARNLDERPKRLKVRFVAPPGVALDLERDGRLSISIAGNRPHRFDLRNRWIADHPVPLELNGAVLYVDPVDANRFRVTDRPEEAPGAAAYACLSLAAAVALCAGWASLLAATAGTCAGYMGMGMGRRLGKWKRRSLHGRAFRSP